MDASMINKIQKASEYASQPERATFNSLRVEFDGANSHYTVQLGADGWSCTCAGFHKYAICPHVMALESLFKPMLKRRPVPYSPGAKHRQRCQKSQALFPGTRPHPHRLF